MILYDKMVTIPVNLVSEDSNILSINHSVRLHRDCVGYLIILYDETQIILRIGLYLGKKKKEISKRSFWLALNTEEPSFVEHYAFLRTIKE